MKNWWKHVALITTFGLAALFSWSIGDPFRRVAAGPSVSAEDPGCAEKAKAYQDHALVYLGDEFEGLPLRTCRARYFPATDYGIPESQFFVFVYGCVPVASDEGDRCVAELQVTIFPCDAPELADEVKEKGELKLRGTKASKKLDGSAYLEGPTVNVMVSPGRHTQDGAEQVERAVKKLKGANDLAASFDESASFSDTEKIKPGAKGACN